MQSDTKREQSSRENDTVQPETTMDVASVETTPTDDTAPAQEGGEKLRREMEEYRSLLQRERADFINYRRRVEAERGSTAAYARADALQPILPILDDLERATTEVPAELREQPWVKGVLLIANQLEAALSTAGLQRIDALGKPFDPRYHEALMYETHHNIPAGNVSMVIRTGYRVGDRVVRAAQVAVSRGTGEESARQEES